MKKVYVYTPNDGPYAARPAPSNAEIISVTSNIYEAGGFYFHNPPTEPGFIPWHAIQIIRLVDEPD
jgi:hypothetical protein